MAIDQYGRFIRTAPSPRINIPVRESSYSNSYSSRYGTPWYENIWNWFDDAISSVGNFLADKGFSAAELITRISAWIYTIGLVIWVIGKWSSDGFLWTIVYALGAVIMFGIGCIGIGLFSWLLQLVVGALRFVFWNGISFLAIVGVVIGLTCLSNCSGSKTSQHVSNQAEIYTPTYPKYECTAEVLNIRTYPSTASPVVGTLRKGNQVEVIEIENGFAAIEYKGMRRYASLQYLSKQ